MAELHNFKHELSEQMTRDLGHLQVENETGLNLVRKELRADLDQVREEMQ